MQKAENQPTKNTNQEQSWRDTIRQAAQDAKNYAAEVTKDYLAELKSARAEDEREEARRTADALRHAAAWIETAAKINEALDTKKDDEAARKVAGAIEDAGYKNAVTAWCCPITVALGKAAQEALTAATSTTPGTATINDEAGAAAALTRAYAQANRWG